ncbi:MAG TPA: outer membrane beta-barrel protein [Gemmatimonadaceae bacterium]
MSSRIGSLIAVALITASYETASAQASLLGPGAVYIGGGVSSVATGKLDDRLAEHGYPTFGQRMGAVTLGGYRRLSSGIMLGAELNGLIKGEKSHNGNDVGLGGGYGTLGIGYAMDLSRGARFYPRLGIGAGGFGMWIERDDEPVAFDDVIDNPAPETETRHPVLSRDGLVADLGAGLELHRGRSGPMIGLRFGYLAAPFNSHWDNYDRDVIDGPDASISGPYVRIVIGGAWKR